MRILTFARQKSPTVKGLTFAAVESVPRWGCWVAAESSVWGCCPCWFGWFGRCVRRWWQSARCGCRARWCRCGVGGGAARCCGRRVGVRASARWCSAGWLRGWRRRRCAGRGGGSAARCAAGRGSLRRWCRRSMRRSVLGGGSRLLRAEGALFLWQPLPCPLPSPAPAGGGGGDEPAAPLRRDGGCHASDTDTPRKQEARRGGKPRRKLWLRLRRRSPTPYRASPVR